MVDDENVARSSSKASTGRPRSEPALPMCSASLDRVQASGAGRDHRSLSGCAVLVPVKSFSAAKARLAPSLHVVERASLARAMAARVLSAADPLPVAVVCDDEEVAAWARQQGALVLFEPARGLDGAVASGVSRLADAGANEVLVAHADLPHASRLGRLAGFGGVTLVPDRRLDGTNVIAVPARAGFRFSYGPGSFARHKQETARLGLAVRIVDEPSLAWDIDVPGDLPAELRTELFGPRSRDRLR